MAKESNQQDRNFDLLADRFQKNIYGGLKGQIRLAVLERDFTEFLPIAPFAALSEQKPLRILDAGGGQGQFSLSLARAGHSVVLCDISEQMLLKAQEEINALDFEGGALKDRVQLIHCAIQDLPQHIDTQNKFDLVLCHAVLEWVVNPKDILESLMPLLKPSGYLSIIFYNLNALIYKNLLRTNFKKIQTQSYGGAKGSLTPINPLDPDLMLSFIEKLPLKLLTNSGIRVFHDFIFNEEHRERDPDSLVELELRFSRQLPYRDLGRYIHLLCQSDGLKQNE